jgi:hypothetical protein
VPDALLIGLDVESRIGDDVNGPEHVFASVLAELVVRDKDLKRARLLAARLLKDPPVIEPHTAAPSYAPTP